jgi:hypothetical protein
MKTIHLAIFAATFGILTACSDEPSRAEDELETSSAEMDGLSAAESGLSSGSSGNVKLSSGAVLSSSSSEEKCDAFWSGNSEILINEILPGNVNWLDDEGNDPGWIELYNTTSKPISLAGYALAKKASNPRKWVFGDDTIPANGYRIVFASNRDIATPLAGMDSDSAHFRAHMNWKLKDSGGSVFLVGADCGVLDSVSYPALESGISWGKTADGWKYFAKSTPEADNAESEGFSGLVAAPVFSQSGGFYTDSVVILPPSAEEGSTVRCTFDGSEPTAETEEMSEAKVITSNMVVRCAAFSDGLITNKITTNTYFIDESVKMPVVAVTVDPEFFEKHYVQTSASSPSAADPNKTGLFADVEYPAHVEYFENGSSSTEKAWESDAGIALMGNYSRLEKKKSVAVKMGEEYNSGWIEYPLFETRKSTNSKFKAFNLRNNGNRFASDYIEDAMGGAILEGSGVDYQRSRQVVVFYNGEYYGIHDMRERFNKNFVETNYGYDASSVNFVKHINRTVTASNGTVDDYKNMLTFVAQSDLSGENNAAYETVKTLMDVGNFADYMAAEIYSHNGDWPNNNVRAWKSPEQPWKFMVYDLDHGYDWMWPVNGFGQSTNMFDWIRQGGTSSGKCVSSKSGECFHTLFVKLSENPDFKRMFINRSAMMLENYLNASKVKETVVAMTATIDADEITRDIAKFGQDKRGYSNSCGGGFSKSGSCLKTWAESRGATVHSEYVSEFGLGDDVTISVSAIGNGSVQLEGKTLPASFTGTFFGGNAIELLAVPADGASFIGWEDGSTENPRLVNPAGGETYGAAFQ